MLDTSPCSEVLLLSRAESTRALGDPISGSITAGKCGAMNCVASHAKKKLNRRLRQNNPTGKSVRIFRNSVKPKNHKESKIFLLSRRANHCSKSARLTRQGASAVVTYVAVGC